MPLAKLQPPCLFLKYGNIRFSLLHLGKYQRFLLTSDLSNYCNFSCLICTFYRFLSWKVINAYYTQELNIDIFLATCVTISGDYMTESYIYN